MDYGEGFPGLGNNNFTQIFLKELRMEKLVLRMGTREAHRQKSHFLDVYRDIRIKDNISPRRGTVATFAYTFPYKRNLS